MAAAEPSAVRNKGTLTPGMLADLAVLSQDIFTVPVEALPKTESVLTMIGGQIEYDAHAIRGLLTDQNKLFDWIHDRCRRT